MTAADIPLASLTPRHRLGQVRAALEEHLRALAAECPAHELRQVCDALGCELAALERLSPPVRRAAVELWRAGGDADTWASLAIALAVAAFLAVRDCALL